MSVPHPNIPEPLVITVSDTTARRIRLPEEVEKDINQYRLFAFNALGNGQYDGAIRDIQRIIELQKEYENSLFACL